MKLLAVLCLAGLITFCSCGNHKQAPNNLAKDSTQLADSARNAFFPVAEYLESEILRVDSTPWALKRYTTSNGKTDTALIQVTEFNTLALRFLPDELHNGSFEKNYTENAFMDKTTQSITFTYSTTQHELPLQRVDVQTFLVNNKQQVKSVYLEKNRHSGDSVILEKLYWRGGRGFQMMTMASVKGKPLPEQQIRVTWNDAEEE